MYNIIYNKLAFHFQKISELKVKFVKSLGSYPVGRNASEVHRFLVKDIHGDSITLSVWEDLNKKVNVGKALRVTNLKTEKFPPQKPHFIGTTMITKISDLSKEEDELFEKITLADGTIAGKCDMIFGAYIYDCCTHCKCKVDNSMIQCGVCKKFIHERNKTFKYQVCLDLGNEEMFNIVGFKDSLDDLIKMPNPFPDEFELEDLLNDKLGGKHVEIQYTISKKEEKIIFKILPTTE